MSHIRLPKFVFSREDALCFRITRTASLSSLFAVDCRCNRRLQHNKYDNNCGVHVLLNMERCREGTCYALETGDMDEKRKEFLGAVERGSIYY